MSFDKYRLADPGDAEKSYAFLLKSCKKLINTRKCEANRAGVVKAIEAGISEGDTVIIKKTDTADSGKIVVALIDNHEAMLKRIRRKGKTIALESANRNYETKIFGPDRVKVQGILVSLYRNF